MLKLADLPSIANGLLQRNQFIGDCPVCGYPTAFSATERNGQLLVHCHVGCNQATLFKALTQNNLQPFSTAKVAKPAKVTAPQEYIFKIWNGALPATGSLVERYLQARHINHPIPSTVRFLPEAYHTPTQTKWPCMVTAVWDLSSQLVAIHRTFLNPDGKGKAPVNPTKMTLGHVGGNAIHLAEPNEILAITEGIETGLSIQQATGIPTWAAISAGGIASLILPALPKAKTVIICADADSVGISFANKAAEKWSLEGRTITIAVPPQGGQDFNDVLQEGCDE